VRKGGLEVGGGESCHRWRVAGFGETENFLVLAVRNIGERAIQLGRQTNVRLGLRAECADVGQQPLTSAVLVQREMQFIVPGRPITPRSRHVEPVQVAGE